MPVAATDLVAYGAANHPTDDVSSVGGAIDDNVRVEFTDIAANDDIEVISTAAGDTQNCTVTGRNAAGELVTETAALTGTTAKLFAVAGIMERIESVIAVSDAIGVLTIRRAPAGLTIATVPIGERGIRRMFINSFSSPDNPKDYYEKLFFKNNHATLSLLAAAISESADPTALITFALGNAKGDTTAAANRLTAPAATTAFDNAAKNVPVNGNLGALETIAVWLKLALAQNNAPNKNTYTLQIAGNSA